MLQVQHFSVLVFNNKICFQWLKCNVHTSNTPKMYFPLAVTQVLTINITTIFGSDQDAGYFSVKPDTIDLTGYYQPYCLPSFHLICSII